VAIGKKHGACTQPGDSGGPVYNVQATGYVRVKGVHSAGGGGGSDHYSGALESPCTEVFTDVWRADDAWSAVAITH